MGAVQVSMMVVAGVVVVTAALRGTWSPCGLSMISAINPFSERSRGHRYPVTCLWYVVGALLGASLTGAVAAGGAWLVALWAPSPLVPLVLGAVAAVVALAADRRFAGFRLPLHPRQVNERWLDRYRRFIYAAGFGAQIGTGFATYIMTSATYLMVVLAVLGGSPLRAFALMLLFGLVRGLTVLLTVTARDAGRLMRLHRALERHEAGSLRGCMAVEAAAAMVLAFTGAGLSGLAVAVLVAAVVLGARPLAGRLRAPRPATR